MPADAPTIVATSGGYRPGRRTDLELGPLVQHAVDRSGATGRPRVCHVGTASGDQRWFSGRLAEAARIAGYELNELTLFTQPNVEDLRGFLLDQDVVWVGGGSVVNLLAVWRAHGLDEVF
ncbi:MAG: type 1 glutamine amidotransferase-like domain-containing protein, partial [Actinomycetales bacterium]|nr:type 1 glutamine amidotransferase-like domain-containing protein [Actinomycetales bacterium]